MSARVLVCLHASACTFVCVYLRLVCAFPCVLHSRPGAARRLRSKRLLPSRCCASPGQPRGAGGGRPPRLLRGTTNVSALAAYSVCAGTVLRCPFASAASLVKLCASRVFLGPPRSRRVTSVMHVPRSTLASLVSLFRRSWVNLQCTLSFVRPALRARNRLSVWGITSGNSSPESARKRV